jgi:hypothetical protein
LTVGALQGPFILIGDLDRLLRRAIARAVPIDEVISHCGPQGRRLSGHKDMSMGDYQRVLETGAVEPHGMGSGSEVFRRQAG